MTYAHEVIYPVYLGNVFIGKFTHREIVELNILTQAIVDDVEIRVSLVDRIIDEVCKTFVLTRTELMSKGRPQHIAWPRQIAIALCYELSGRSANEVKRWFGKSDHTTVLYAQNVVKNREADCLADGRVIKRIRATIREAIAASNARDAAQESAAAPADVGASKHAK